MDTTQDLKQGQVVKSKAGRDKGNVFVVKEIVDDKFVLVCDGNLRKISVPKLKRVKHLVVYNTVFEEFVNMLKDNKKINDAAVRKLLEDFLTNKH